MEVAAYVHTVGYGAVHRPQHGGQVSLTHGVVAGADAVLGHVHRLPELAHLVEHVAHPGWIRSPAHVRDRHPRHVATGDELLARPPEIEGGVLRPVVRDADPIGLGLHHPFPAHPSHRPAVHEALGGACGPAVAHGVAFGQEQEAVMTEADARVRKLLVNGAIGGKVRLAHVCQHAPDVTKPQHY